MLTKCLHFTAPVFTASIRGDDPSEFRNDVIYDSVKTIGW